MDTELGPLLNHVGILLAEDKDYALDGTFLYVEAGPGWADMSIFKDLGDRILYRDATPDLAHALMELWEAAAPDKRWSTM